MLFVCVCCGTEFVSTKDLFSSLNKVREPRHRKDKQKGITVVLYLDTGTNVYPLTLSTHIYGIE